MKRKSSPQAKGKQAVKKDNKKNKVVLPVWGKRALCIGLIAVVVVVIVGIVLYALMFSENAQNKKAVATSGEYEISYEQLRFITMTYKIELDAQYGDGIDSNGTIWDDPATSEAHRAELEELVWSTIAENYAVLEACAGYKIGKNAFEGKEIKKAVDQQIADLIAEYPTKSDFKDALKESYATENVFRFYFALDEMKYLLYTAMQTNGAFVTEEKAFEEWLRNNNGAYVQHIMLLHYSEEEKEENREILEDARQKFLSGEWTLADCINRANDDLSNVAPYYLVRGVHKDVMVDAAVDLDVGDASEVIETDSGLYVIIRMEETPIQGANGTTETPLSLQLTNLLSTYQWAIVGDAVEAAKANLNIQLTDYGKSLDLVAMK